DGPRLLLAAAAPRAGAHRGSRAPAPGRGNHRLPRDQRDPPGAGRPLALRAAEAGRAWPRARHGARPPAARRADGRHEPRGEGGHVALHQRREQPLRHDDRADRARHGRGDGPVKPRARARLRPQDRRRHPRRGEAGPQRHRRVSGRRALMNLLYQIFIDPFVQMGTAPDLLVQTLWQGLVGGVLYSLIALGFVLIFKASGVFNFAQGIMVVFAAMSLVSLHALGIPAFVALALTFAVMLALAWGVERLVLRPLVNQPDIILFMATFGLTYFLIGFGELVFGGEPKIMIRSEERRVGRA